MGELDERVGWVAVRIEQGGDQSGALAHPGAIRSGHRQIGQMPQDRRAAGGLGAGEQHRPGGGDVGEKGIGVKPPIQQHEHARSQPPEQPPG